MSYSKAFVLNTREVEGRLDPFYYQQEFIDLKEKINQIDFKYLSRLSTKILDGIHKTPKYSDKGLIFLQANNIKEGYIDFEKNIKYLASEWNKEVINRYTPRAGDVLITKDGTIGVSATVPNNFKDFSIFVSVMAIRPRKDIIIPEFLRIMISSNIVQMQIKQLTKGAVLSHLLLGEAKKLKIPLPPKETQNKIIDIMDNAYKIKKSNEKRAKELLDSIDDYLLDKLGITLPKEEKVVSFISSSSEVFGNRFDPNYNHPKYDYYKNFKNIYLVTTIKKISLYIQTGFAIRKDNRKDNGVIPYYGANGIIGYMNDYTHNGTFLVVGQDGYIGNHYVVQGKFWASNHNWVLKLKENINIFFVKEFLDFWNYDYLITGSVIPKITKESLKSIQIPLPPLTIQNEIASHIQSLREEAKRLQEEAKEVLRSAKDEVEKIILGDDKIS